MGRRDKICRDSALKRGLDLPAVASMVPPRLAAADFVSEERLQNICPALSLNRQPRRRPDARDAAYLGRPEPVAD
jgi:hypothetical protein